MSRYYQGRFIPSYPKKYLGDPTNIIFRSSLELRFMQYLDSNSNIIGWENEETIVPYYDPSTNKWRRYFPDFVIVVKSGSGTITQMIEIKPASQCQPPKVPAKRTKRFISEMLTWGTNSSKWKAADEYCKDRKWVFKIITDKDIQSF